MREKINPVFFGEVKGGRISLDTEQMKKRFKDRLFQLEGKKIQLTLNRRTKKRSLKQNSYYWGAIVPMIAEEVGMLEEEVHDALRLMFLKDRTGKLETIRSTTQLTTGQFVEYLFDIQVWASSFLNIEKWPDPNEWELKRVYEEPEEPNNGGVRSV